MTEIFKTVLILSGLGSVLTLILILLKPVAIKHFSAGWQYIIWFIAALCMIVPAWKAVPVKAVRQTVPRMISATVQPEIKNEGTKPENAEVAEKPVLQPQPEPEARLRIDFFESAAYIWFFGMCIFIIYAVLNYGMFLYKKRQISIELSGSEVFEEIKRELNIRRKIKLRVLPGSQPPMLVGVFFPVIYLPETGMDKTGEKMVFRHELTHYKRRDLAYKWMILIINGVHWFNPFAYILGENINQTCEFACDMAVVSRMETEEKNLYMKTILEIASKEG